MSIYRYEKFLGYLTCDFILKVHISNSIMSIVSMHSHHGHVTILVEHKLKSYLMNRTTTQLLYQSVNQVYCELAKSRLMTVALLRCHSP